MPNDGIFCFLHVFCSKWPTFHWTFISNFIREDLLKPYQPAVALLNLVQSELRSIDPPVIVDKLLVVQTTQDLIASCALVHSYWIWCSWNWCWRVHIEWWIIYYPCLRVSMKFTNASNSAILSSLWTPICQLTLMWQFLQESSYHTWVVNFTATAAVLP